MKDTWLVQRLQKPYDNDQVGALMGALSFGGGLRNGGLSKDAMAIVSQAFSFDYMGSAEFEWGAVPKALDGIVGRRKRLVARESTIPSKDTEHPLFVICDKGDVSEVLERVRSWALPWGERPQMKEQTMLDRALDGDERYCGWLELDNGFFAFTDETMWRNTAEVFDIKAKATVSK